MKSINLPGLTAAAALVIAVTGGAVGAAIALDQGSEAAAQSPASVRLDSVAATEEPAPSGTLETPAPVAVEPVDEPSGIEDGSEPVAQNVTSETPQESADRAQDAADRADDSAKRAEDAADRVEKREREQPAPVEQSPESGPVVEEPRAPAPKPEFDERGAPYLAPGERCLPRPYNSRTGVQVPTEGKRNTGPWYCVNGSWTDQEPPPLPGYESNEEKPQSEEPGGNEAPPQPGD